MTFHLSTTTLGGGAAGDGGQRPPNAPKPRPKPRPAPRTPDTQHVHALRTPFVKGDMTWPTTM